MPSIMPVRRNVLYRVPAAAVATGTTFDSTTKSTHITLDATKLIATSIAGSGNGTIAFSTTSHTTGKFYVEFTLTTKVTAAGFDAIGLAGASFPVDTATFLGQGNSLGFYDDGTTQGAAASAGNSYVQGNVVCLAVDLGTGSIWRRINGGSWLGSGAAGDPFAGTNPGGESITGAVFLAITAQASGDVWTLNAGSTFAFTPPVGYGNW